jgi:D-alanyl-D-alanine carboxypeptidase
MRIGSVSKTYVATLVMKLVEEGAWQLDTTLAEALPDVVARIPQADRITLLQLLGHRSGVLNPETQDLFAQTDYFDRPDQLIPLTLDERFERYVYDRPLLFPPGTSRRYSNPGYDLLGLAVARREGTSLQQALERMVLAPLGHTATSFLDRDREGIARGYVDTAEGRLIDVTENDKANVNELSPSGGLVSTAAEVSAFMRALSSDTLISRASRETMETGEGQLRQGLMAALVDGQAIAFGHQGALIGESTWALYFPAEDAVVVVMVNSDGSADDVAFARRFLE